MELELELQGWKVRAGLVALAVFVIALPFGCATRANKARAEDWHKRAVVAEESVTGLRTVIVERSRALNRRTVQANELASRLDSTRAALRLSKVDVGALTRRQRDLASENARIQTASRKLRARQAALARLASKLSACTKGLDAVLGSARNKRTLSSDARARLASCTKVSASLDAYLGRAP